LENIAGNDFMGLNLIKTTLTENSRLQGKRLFQFIDNRSGLEFLYKTNPSIQQEEGTDNAEVNPVFETGSKNSCSLWIENR
jgi:hypothetical protein